MRTFNRLCQVNQMTLRWAAARLIPRFFFGTTDETTTVAASRPRKIRAIRSALRIGVAILEARSMLEREAKANLVNELLTSISKNLGSCFFIRSVACDWEMPRVAS